MAIIDHNMCNIWKIVPDNYTIRPTIEQNVYERVMPFILIKKGGLVELDGLKKNTIVLNVRSQSPARSAWVEVKVKTCLKLKHG